ASQAGPAPGSAAPERAAAREPAPGPVPAPAVEAAAMAKPESDQPAAARASITHADPASRGGGPALDPPGAAAPGADPAREPGGRERGRAPGSAAPTGTQPAPAPGGRVPEPEPDPLGPVLPGRPEAKRPRPTTAVAPVEGAPCPVCGTANPPGRRVCRDCGTLLDPAARPAGASRQRCWRAR